MEEKEIEMKLNCSIEKLKAKNVIAIKDETKTNMEALEGSLCEEDTFCKDLDNDCQIKGELEEVCVKDELLDLSDYETSIKNIEIEEEFVGTVIQPFSFEESSGVAMPMSVEKNDSFSKSRCLNSERNATKPGVSLTARPQEVNLKDCASSTRTITETSGNSAPAKRNHVNTVPFDKAERGDQEIFQCSECSYETKGKYQLKIHLLTHSQEKLFKCSDCDFSTNWKVELKAHENKHFKLCFNCVECKYQTNHKCHMRSHMRMHAELKFKCPQCDYKTNWKAYMKIHSLTHLDKKLFKCSQCEYETNFKSHLKTHLLKHSGSKVWKCHECSYTTHVKHLLKLHLLKHSSVKLFKCSQCSYETNRRSYMRNHYLKHTDKKLFQCSNCNYETNIRRQIRIHELNHAKQKLYRCSECNFETNLKKCLMLHTCTHAGTDNGPEPATVSGQWMDKAAEESESYDQTEATTEAKFLMDEAQRKAHRGYQQTQWTLEDKKTILSCFEYSRFEGWGRQKGRILKEQIEKCNLPPEKKGESSMAKICSLISKIPKFLPEEERQAIQDEARRKAREDLASMDDERKTEIKRSSWSLEEKWRLVWAAEYTQRRNPRRKDYSYSHLWKELFSRLCPYKRDVSIDRLRSLKNTMKSRGLFTQPQIRYMEEKVRHLLWSNLSPVKNPIPYPTPEDLASTPPPSPPFFASPLEGSSTSPVIYLPSLKNPITLLLVECQTMDSNLDPVEKGLEVAVDKRYGSK